MWRVAVVLPEFMFDVSDIVRGIARYTRNRPELAIHDLFFQHPDQVTAKLARGAYQGAVTSLVPIDFEALRPHLSAKLAIVNIGADPLGPGIGWLCNSDEAMVRLALEHVRDAGFQRLALLGAAVSPTWQRRMALLCRQAPPLAVDEAFDWKYSYDDPDEPRSFKALETWLAQVPSRSCVITCHGYAARCVSLACKQLGRAVPSDVGILSLLDERWCLFGHPAISAVRMNGLKLGHEAIKLLDRMLQRRKPSLGIKEFAPRRIAARRSTTALKKHSPEIAKALAFIKENACSSITVKEVLAATQTVSRRKFYDEFTAQVGRSPAEQIRQEKIARAQELLRDSTLSVRRISELCGFKNVTRFQVQFYQQVGQKPSQFRQRIK